jgi:hypothetical protein
MREKEPNIINKDEANDFLNVPNWGKHFKLLGFGNARHLESRKWIKWPATLQVLSANKEIAIGARLANETVLGAGPISGKS